MENILIIIIGICILIALVLILKNNKIDKNKVDFLELENKRLNREKQSLENQKTNIHTELIETRTRLRANIEHMQDWEKTKKQFIEQAKSTSMELSQNLVSDLLDKHNKQAETQRKENEETISQNTKKLHESYETLFSSVNILKDSLEKSNDTVNTIKSALSSSAEVGYASETILENTLTAFGLTEGVDFLTQVNINIDNKQLRPDGLIFMPNNCALVIDSKASKFIYELAQAEQQGDIEEIKQANENLRLSMNNHLNSLSKKDYKSIIQKLLKQQDKRTTLNDITFVMWLPNDSCVEKLQKSDPKIMQKASMNNIFICGPTALWTAIGIASQKINTEKQSQNNHKIREEIEKLLGYIGTIVDKGNKLERGLNSANSAWVDFKKSFNSRFIVSAKRVENYGVKSSKNIQLLGKEYEGEILEIDNQNIEVENQNDEIEKKIGNK